MVVDTIKINREKRNEKTIYAIKLLFKADYILVWSTSVDYELVLDPTKVTGDCIPNMFVCNARTTDDIILTRHSVVKTYS